MPVIEEQMANVRDTVLDIVQHWPRFPPINVMADAQHLPAPALRQAARTGTDPRTIAAVWHGGQMHINCAHPLMRTRTGIEKSLFHEIWGHYGVRAVLGKEIDPYLNRLTAALGGPVGLEDLARQRGIWNEIEPYFAMSNVWLPSARNAMLLDELVAHLHEQGPPTVKQRVVEYLGAVKDWFARRGFTSMARMNTLDLANLMRQSRRAVTTPGTACLPADRIMTADAGGTNFKIAWHGSRVGSINRFSLAYIGTGEGATAYGYGLYFASRESIGEVYREALAKPAAVVAGEVVSRSGVAEAVGRHLGEDHRPAVHRLIALTEHGMLPDEILRRASNQQERERMEAVIASVSSLSVKPGAAFAIHRDEWTYGHTPSAPEGMGLRRLAAVLDLVGAEAGSSTDDVLATTRSVISNAIEHFEQQASKESLTALSKISLDESRAALDLLDAPDLRVTDLRGSFGQLYAVEIPGPESLLDWDAPLSEQPAIVQKALLKMDARNVKLLAEWQAAQAGESAEGEAHEPTGRELYAALGESEDGLLAADRQRLASMTLGSIGIPGLQYLDGLSRGDGSSDQEHNYVIWDDHAIDILGTRYSIKDDPMTLPPSVEAALRRNVVDLHGIVDHLDSIYDEHGHQAAHTAYQMIAAALDRVSEQVAAYAREMERQGIDAPAIMESMGGLPAHEQRVYIEPAAPVARMAAGMGM